jgi:hypothetical protein
MTQNDADETFPRMYETCETFRAKFRGQKLHIKEGGLSQWMINPLDKQKITLTALIGLLVSEYEKVTDAANTATKRFADDPQFWAKTYSDSRMARVKVGSALSHAISHAYAFDLIDEGFDKRIEELTAENVKLKAEVKKLVSDFKALKTKYDFLDRINSDKLQTDLKSEKSDGQN